MTGFKITAEERARIYRAELSTETPIDLILGASLGAYLGSSIDHSAFDLRQAFAVAVLLTSLWVFVLGIKFASRSLALRHLTPAILVFGCTGAWIYMIPSTLNWGGIYNVLFFQAVMTAWVASYLISAFVIMISDDSA